MAEQPQTTKDLSVLITGGAGGLGKAIASAFLAAGSRVSICDTNAARLASTKEEFLASYPPSHFFAYETDITSEPAVESLVSSVVADAGSLDVLVNNAGIMDSFDPVGTLEKETWDRVLSVNLTGSWLMMKYAVRAMDGGDDGASQKGKGGRGGSIIQIGSTAAVNPMESGVAYTVSKHGVKALVESTAQFYAFRQQGGGGGGGGSGKPPIYATGLMCGPMMGTNIADSVPGGLQNKMNLEFFARTPGGKFQGKIMEMQAKAQAGDMEAASGLQAMVEGFSTRIEDVARYCVFLSDRRVAASSNGKCIAFSKDAPVE